MLIHARIVGVRCLLGMMYGIWEELKKRNRKQAIWRRDVYGRYFSGCFLLFLLLLALVNLKKIKVHQCYLLLY